MNDTTTNAKTGKRMAGSFDPSKFEMPRVEVPVEFREMTDKGIAHAKQRIIGRASSGYLATPCD